jgi:hypothetical protein
VELLGGASSASRFQAQPAQEFVAWDPAVGAAARDPRQGSARAHDRIEQPPRRLAIAKFQPVRDDRFNPEMVRQRPQHVFQELPHQNDTLAVADRFD